MTVEQDKQQTATKQQPAVNIWIHATCQTLFPLKFTNEEPGDLQTLYLKAMMSLQKHCQQVMDSFYHGRLEEERGRGFHIL